MPQLDDMEKIFDIPIENSSIQVALQNAVDSMEGDVEKGLSNIQNINSRIKSLYIENVLKDVTKVEDFR